MDGIPVSIFIFFDIYHGRFVQPEPQLTISNLKNLQIWDLENDIQPILATSDPKNDLGIKFFLHIFD